MWALVRPMSFSAREVRVATAFGWRWRSRILARRSRTRSLACRSSCLVCLTASSAAAKPEIATPGRHARRKAVTKATAVRRARGAPASMWRGLDISVRRPYACIRRPQPRSDVGRAGAARPRPAGAGPPPSGVLESRGAGSRLHLPDRGFPDEAPFPLATPLGRPGPNGLDRGARPAVPGRRAGGLEPVEAGPAGPAGRHRVSRRGLAGRRPSRAAGDLQARSPDLHRAGEPVVRSLLRDLSGRERVRHAGRGADQLRARPRPGARFVRVPLDRGPL